MKRIFLYLILLFLVLYRPVSHIASHHETYFLRTYNTRYEALKKLYYSSQYVVRKNPVIIPDETIEAFAAGAFLRGMNPIHIIHDHPPLGKYILSFSILLFNNENTIIIFFFFISLVGTFLIMKSIINNNLYALLPCVIFVNEPLMFSKIVYTPIPEIIQLPFILFTVYFFLQMIKSKKNTYLWAVLTSIFLGGVISTRFFALGTVLLLSQVLFLVYKKNYRILWKYFLTLPLSCVVLLLSYAKTIEESSSLMKPFAVQKYILSYHSSKFIKMFTVWDLLFFNRWHTWWGEQKVISDVNWIILWPISSVLSLSIVVLSAFKKIKILPQEEVILFWVILYLCMLSIGYASVRYFLPLIPFLYVLALCLLYRLQIVRRIFSV